jgi:RNA polymerase sigma-70 factor (ECF subfamily)
MSLARWALAWPALDRRRVPLERHRRVRELLQDHVEAVWRTARRLGVPVGDIEDVVQDVMLVVLRRLSDIAPDKERAFLVGTTVRVAANRRRRQRRHPEHSMAAEVERTGQVDASNALTLARGEQSVETTRQLALLQAALAEMTPEQRDTFVLFELEELSAREVAEQLGVSQASVVSRVRRAREVLWAVCERSGYPHGGLAGPLGLAERKP